MVQEDKQEKFETYFRPKNQHQFENEFDLNFAPFPKLDKAQKLSEDQENSINTYWSKEGEEGEKGEEEKIQQDISLDDTKTQKISNVTQEERKEKKTNNPWPDT